MRQLVLVLIAAMAFTSSQAESPFKKQPEMVFAIQLGAFSNPQVSDFESVKNIGYVYTEAVGKLQRVLLGRFEEEKKARATLSLVKAAGYGDAFLTKRKINPSDMIYSVQLKSYDAKKAVEWDKWRTFDNLHINLTADNKTKVLTGNFTDIRSVNQHLQLVKSKGFKGVYIKHINRGLVHKVSKFEMSISEIDIINMDGGVNVKGGDIITVKPSDIPVSYNDFNDKKRKSVEKLQELLKQHSNYSGKLDGKYGNGTKDAFDMFEKKNSRYIQYKMLADNRIEEKFKGGIQSYVDLVYSNPFMAYGGLKEADHPMANVYLAYMYFVGKANPKTENKQVLVNRLMNGAVQAIFVTGDFKGTTELDYSKTYDYNNISLLIKHLSYMQDAMQDPPSLPCWLFEEHPQEAASMFNRLYSMVSGCGDFMEWDELKVLKTIAEDLDPVNHLALGKGDENVKMAYDSRRAQLYLAPTISQDEAMVMEAWNNRLWSAMKIWEGKDLLHQKMVAPLEVAYYQALVKLENHYLGRGFKEKQAQVLGLSVLRTVVNYHLNSYTK